MAISSRQVQNKRDSNGVLTGKPGTVYDVNIKYNSPEGKKTYSKKGFATKKEAAQHDAEAFLPADGRAVPGADGGPAASGGSFLSPGASEEEFTDEDAAA